MNIQMVSTTSELSQESHGSTHSSSHPPAGPTCIRVAARVHPAQPGPVKNCGMSEAQEGDEDRQLPWGMNQNKLAKSSRSVYYDIDLVHLVDFHVGIG
jgi:hypothetical protein